MTLHVEKVIVNYTAVRDCKVNILSCVLKAEDSRTDLMTGGLMKT